MELGPEDAEARLRCGEMLLDGLRFDEAKEAFSMAHGTKAERPAVRRGMANCLLSGGDTDQARQMLVDLLREQPDDAAAMRCSGKLELGQSSSRRGEMAATGGRPGMHSIPWPSYNLSVCHGTTSRPKRKRSGGMEGSNALTNRANFSHKIGQAWRSRAAAATRHSFEEQRASGRSHSLAETGLRLDPNHAATYDTLAECYGHLGDPRRQEAFRNRRIEIRKMPPR